MSGGRTLFRNAAAMLALGLLQRSLGLVSVSLLARVLDTRGLGAFAFTQSTGQTFFGLARLGADAGLHVRVADVNASGETLKADALLGEALSTFILIAGAGAVLLCLLAQPIATHLFAAPELAPLVMASAVLFAAQVATQFCYTVFAGLNAFVAYAGLTMMTSLLAMTLTVIGGVAFGVTGAVWGAAAANACTALAMGVRLRSELARRGLSARPRWPSGEVRSLLAIGFPFYASGLLLIPTDFMCVAFLSRVAGVDALGDLRVTQTLMGAATMIPTALSGPLISHLTGRLAGESGPAAVLDQLKAVWILSLPLVIGLGAVWPMLIDIVFGAAFSEARSVGSLALAAFVPSMLLSVLTGTLLALRRSLPLMLVGALHALTVATLASVLIAGHELAGYLGVQAAGMAVGALASAVIVARQFEARFFRPWMVPLLLITGAISALLVVDVAVEETLTVRLAVSAAMAALMLVIVWTSVLGPAERLALKTWLTAAARGAVTRTTAAAARGKAQ